MTTTALPLPTAPQNSIGQILLSRGKITEEQLAEALSYQREKGGRLGWILASLGFVNRLTLYQALAQHFTLPFEPDQKKLLRAMDRKLLRDISYQEIVDYQAIPYQMEGGVLILLTTYPNASKTLRFYLAHFSVETIRQIVITDLDLCKITETVYGNSLTDKAIYGLFYRNPEECAYKVFSKRQVVLVGMVFLLFLIGLYADAKSVLLAAMAIAQVFYLLAIGFKFLLSIVGARHEIEKPITDNEVAALRDEDLPVYTVLVPVYREPEVIATLIAGLQKLDYPQNKLDLLLLMEEDDSETLAAAKKQSPSANWKFIIVPKSFPKTKPKACNYGLSLCQRPLFCYLRRGRCSRVRPTQKSDCGVSKIGGAVYLLPSGT